MVCIITVTEHLVEYIAVFERCVIIFDWLLELPTLMVSRLKVYNCLIMTESHFGLKRVKCFKLTITEI